jgi:hypothetical protein
MPQLKRLTQVSPFAAARVGGGYSGSAVVPRRGSCESRPGLPEKRRRGGWCFLAPSVSLPLASPRLSSSTYTLVYRDGCRGRVGTSPVKLTNQFPEVNPPSTLTLGRRLTASAAVPTILRGVGPPCFTHSRGLALRLGRNVNPPQVLSPGSFVTAC